MLTVVAALIVNEGKILIAKRSTGDPNVRGNWEFPGGKVEKGEDEFKAIEREINEEFELKIKAREFLKDNIWEYPDRIIDLRLYKCDYISGEFKLNDHSEYKFVPKEDLLKYDLCPADVSLAEYVINNYNID